MSDVDDVIIEPENDGAEEKADTKVKKVRNELKRIQAERDEYLAGWQRSKADYVNLSRRMREQEAASSRQGVAKLARSVIAVFDSLEAAKKVAESDGTSSVVQGLIQVEKQMESALLELGVARVTPEVGASFDPLKHEPIQTVACTEENLDNTVSEVFQSGFEIDGVVIRPARVAVCHYQP